MVGGLEPWDCKTLQQSLPGVTPNWKRGRPQTTGRPFRQSADIARPGIPGPFDRHQTCGSIDSNRWRVDSDTPPYNSTNDCRRLSLIP